jgi:hypothetical protein
MSFCFIYFEKKSQISNSIGSLALMGTASFWGGVRPKRYSGQQELDNQEKTSISLLKRKPNEIETFSNFFRLIFVTL